MKTHKSAAFLAATIALAGCGGGAKPASTESSSASTVVSKAQFVARADAICQRLNTEFEAAKAASQSVHEIVRLAPQRAVSEQRVVSELSALTPPAGVAGDFRNVIAYRRTLARELAELASVAKRNDTAAIRRLGASKERMHKRLIAAATAAGILSCAKTG